MSRTVDNIAWSWKMDWCLRNKLPPAQDWAWKKAGEAYQKRSEVSNG